MLVMKPPKLSARPRQKVGKIFFKTQCQIQTAQIYGKSSKIWTVLLMPSPPNEAMSYNGRTITDIKSNANVFINHYARLSKLNMSLSYRDLNQQYKKRLNAPSVDNESWAPLHMGQLQSAIKKMKGKGAQHSTFFSQVSRFIGPPGITIHFQLILFTWSLPMHLEGCHNYSITESWEISQWSCIFLSHQSHIMFPQTSGKYFCWPSLLYRRNQ